MVKWLIGLFVVMHGLVHLWYVVLSQKLVAFRPEMGWTGRSWIFTDLFGDVSTRLLASVLYGLAAIALVAGGIGIISRANWGLPVLVAAAVLSATIIVLFWDGNTARVVEKGLLGLIISLALIGGVAGTARYRGEIRAAHERIEQLGSRVVMTDCGPIEYAQTGAGYPVLSIHGNGGGFDQGLSLAETYLGEGFQIIAPSRFGYLGSPLPAGATPEQQADAYACLLDALDVQQVAIFTTSAGVTSSIQFALRHPGRLSAMVLHSPNAPGKVEVQLPPQPVFRALLDSDFLYRLVGTNMISMFVPKEFPLTDQMVADVRQAGLSVLPSSRRANGMVFDTYIGNQEINHYPLEQVETPTLVISAVDDPAALHENARVLAERIPGARLVAIPDGGHLMLGHTEEVKLEIAQFLQNNLALAKNSR